MVQANATDNESSEDPHRVEQNLYIISAIIDQDDLSRKAISRQESAPKTTDFDITRVADLSTTHPLALEVEHSDEM